MRPLSEQVLLIVDRRVDSFVFELRDALERAGADVLVVHHETGAIAHLRRFEINAVLLSELDGPPQTEERLAQELAGLPVLRYGAEDGVAETVQAVTALLIKDRSR